MYNIKQVARDVIIYCSRYISYHLAFRDSIDVVELRAAGILSELCVGILCALVSALLVMLSMPYTSCFPGLINTLYLVFRIREGTGGALVSKSETMVLHANTMPA